MEAAGVRRGVGSVEAALLPLHQLFARRTAAKPPAVAAAAVFFESMLNAYEPVLYHAKDVHKTV